MRFLLPALLLLLQPVITVRTELVVVPVVVTDSHGRHVSDLDEQSFMHEDGHLRPTAAFHRGDAPITLGLIVIVARACVRRRRHCGGCLRRSALGPRRRRVVRRDQ